MKLNITFVCTEDARKNEKYQTSLTSCGDISAAKLVSLVWAARAIASLSGTWGFHWAPYLKAMLRANAQNELKLIGL